MIHENIIVSNKAWSDFFTGQPVIYDGRGERLSGLTGYVYVVDSNFEHLSSASKGGAIYYSSSGSSILLVEKTMFNNVSGSTGGSLYFGSGGECVLSKICSIRSSSTGWYMFSEVYASNSLVKNYVVDSSVCLSTSNNVITLEHQYGNIIFNNNNISSNSCQNIPAFRLKPTENGNNAACSVKYSSITNNKATYWSCILFFNTNNFCLMEFCNILSNIQTDESYGVILSDGDLKISNSCILYNSPRAVEARNCRITLSNCTVDFNNVNISGTVIFTNNPNTNFVNILHHFESGLCVAQHYSLPAKKKICSCRRINVNLVSLADCIFLLSLSTSE
jgi:hypothetical protein